MHVTKTDRLHGRDPHWTIFVKKVMRKKRVNWIIKVATRTAALGVGSKAQRHAFALSSSAVDTDSHRRHTAVASRRLPVDGLLQETVQERRVGHARRRHVPATAAGDRLPPVQEHDSDDPGRQTGHDQRGHGQRDERRSHAPALRQTGTC